MFNKIVIDKGHNLPAVGAGEAIFTETYVLGATSAVSGVGAAVYLTT